MTLEYLGNEFNLNEYEGYILNKSASAKRLEKENLIEQLELLNLHGINTPISAQRGKVKKINYNTIYLVPIFQQKVLAIYRQTRLTTNNWLDSSLVKNKIYLEKVKGFRNKREEKKVLTQAINAVYALNLDFALVKIGVSNNSQAWVLYVNPFPENNGEITSLFEKAIQAFTDRWQKLLEKNNSNVVLGADPEFILQDQEGKLVLASTYLPKSGPAGCDQIWINRDRTQLPLAELRPTPTADPRELLINLYKTMLAASNKIKDKKIKWLAGAMPIPGYPIGGHIHFSNIWLNSFLLRALDNYLTLPLTLLEDKKGANRRPKYGFLGDYRTQFHGGFEYRTPPSWIVSPVVTKGVIALAKLIAENYQYLYQNPLKDINIQIAYYTGDKETLRPVVKKLWNELKTLGDYSLYERYLHPFEELINRGYTWNENSDIRRAWYLPPYKYKKQ